MQFSVPFFQHDLGKKELKAIKNVFETPILTTGHVVAQFEEQFSRYMGSQFALGVTSCTDALHLAMRVSDIGPGDEVITTAMTFLATATAILEAGATPVFVDVEPGTGNIDVEAVTQAITPRTKAIIPVHLYGQMVDMVALRKLADQHGLIIIEDAAHCIEGKRDGVRPGMLGDFACFSFYATKNITCGEGGAIITNQADLIDKMRLIYLHGMSQMASERAKKGYRHWDMVRMGWKFNMSNIDAAMLLPQLKRIDRNLKRRTTLAMRYRKKLAKLEGLALSTLYPNTRHCHHLMTVQVQGIPRDTMIERLQSQGVGVAVNYRPAVPLTKYFSETYGYQPGQFPQAEKISHETLSLPLYPLLKKKQVDFVVTAIAEALDKG
ncbi:DegT/DnrJ/EryC1/StrS family aminotransferase [Magnetococcales bacterium HHB-1]